MGGGGCGFRCENVVHQGVGIFNPLGNKLFFLLSVKYRFLSVNISQANLNAHCYTRTWMKHEHHQLGASHMHTHLSPANDANLKKKKVYVHVDIFP